MGLESRASQELLDLKEGSITVQRIVKITQEYAQYRVFTQGEKDEEVVFPAGDFEEIVPYLEEGDIILVAYKGERPVLMCGPLTHNQIYFFRRE